MTNKESQQQQNTQQRDTSAELAELVAAWPNLKPDIRRQILFVIRKSKPRNP